MISRTFWQGKSVLVTGGSSGIGREACRAAAAAGARIGIIARRQPPLDATCSLLSATGAVVETVSCDVVDGPALRAAVATLEDRLGPCDVAIACAGIHRTSWPLDAEAANTVIDVNVKGGINFISTVLPGMLARRHGHVCGVASIAAVVGLPGNAAYCASKAGLVAFLESLRLDCGPRGVRLSTACPGVVDTPMVTDGERTAGRLMTAEAAAAIILRAIERGRAEVWFPRRTWLAARLARSLPTTVRDWILRSQPRLEQAPSDA
ncbi:MAG: SDR family NAD(P)-dependent oxidoreductase [Planctomycetia bacterium]|nr:SDR family NAD(P)-dependent oxidoreductase [Planctomycetia bacterium]